MMYLARSTSAFSSYPSGLGFGHELAAPAGMRVIMVEHVLRSAIVVL